MEKSKYYLIAVPAGTEQEDIDALTGRLADSGLSGSIVAADVSVIKIG